MFYPIPAVDSVVVRLKHYTHGPRAKDDDVFFWMINGIFPYPNKYLRKAMRIWFRNMKLDKNSVDTVFDACKDCPKGDERLRTISIEKLVNLSDSLLHLIEKGEIPDPRGK